MSFNTSLDTTTGTKVYGVISHILEYFVPISSVRSIRDNDG